MIEIPKRKTRRRQPNTQIQCIDVQKRNHNKNNLKLSKTMKYKPFQNWTWS